jgi:hypothetical protein
MTSVVFVLALGCPALHPIEATSIQLSATVVTLVAKVDEDACSSVLENASG